METITYNLYRADTNQILSVEGMTPLAIKLSVTDFIDPTPSPTEHCYVVTAVDAVGKEIFATSLLPDSPRFIDLGYTDEERTYTIVAVDQNSAQSMGRAITLPKVNFVPESFFHQTGHHEPGQYPGGQSF